MSCREIVEQDLTLKIQKVGQKAKRPQNKKNIPTHPHREKAFVLYSCVRAVFYYYGTDFCSKTIVK